MILAAFFLTAAIAFIAAQQWISLPFVMLFLGGYVYVAAEALKERLNYWRINT